MAAPKNSRMKLFATCVLSLLMAACASRAMDPPLDAGALDAKPLWIARVRNSTASELRLPGTNPLRSLGEMAGKVSPEYRPTIPELLRDALRREAERRKVPVRYLEEYDARLKSLPAAPETAARSGREFKMEGNLLLTEIQRWETEATGLMRARVEFKLVRIADGALLSERRVQKVTPVSRSGNPAEAQQDAVDQIAKELF